MTKSLIDYGLLTELIGIKSTSVLSDDEEPSPSIKKALDLLKRKFGDSFEIAEYQYKNRPAVVFSNTKEKHVDIIFAGHIDVVPAPDKEFCLHEEGDKLFGRGTIDMKSPVIALLAAFAAESAETKLPKIAILVTTDEEIDGLSVKYLLEEVGYDAKFAILPDGGCEDRIVLKQKGFWQFCLNIKGSSCHASKPWEGINPIEIGLGVHKALKESYPDPIDEQSWTTSIALTKVATPGNAHNQIPESATFYYDVRYVEEIDLEQIPVLIETMLSGREYQIETVGQNGSLKVDPNNEFLKKLSDAIENVLGHKPELYGESGTSDAIFFAENGIPATLFRPKGGKMHADGEWVSKSSLESFVEVLRQFLRMV